MASTFRQYAAFHYAVYSQYHRHGLRQLEKLEGRQAETGANEQYSHNGIDTSCLEPLVYKFGSYSVEVTAPGYGSCLERWWLEPRSMAPWSTELIDGNQGRKQM